MEEARILRKTFYHKESKDQSDGAQADEKAAQNPEHEELLAIQPRMCASYGRFEETVLSRLFFLLYRR